MGDGHINDRMTFHMADHSRIAPWEVTRSLREVEECGSGSAWIVTRSLAHTYKYGSPSPGPAKALASWLLTCGYGSLPRDRAERSSGPVRSYAQHHLLQGPDSQRLGSPSRTIDSRRVRGVSSRASRAPRPAEKQLSPQRNAAQRFRHPARRDGQGPARATQLALGTA